MNALIEGLIRWRDISGRTSRITFLRMYVDILVAVFAFMLLAMAIRWNLKLDITFLLRPLVIVLHLPWLTAGIRRMHDRGAPGWWLFVPVVGLILALMKGQPFDNRYGPAPEGSR